MTSKELVEYMYYRCLPKFYLEEDSELGLPLYRYLQTLVFGGYEYNVDAATRLMDLVNPETCPEEYLKALWESFGFNYYEEIKSEYYRKFLMNYGELVRRRGTYAGVRYLARAITGMDVRLKYVRGQYAGKIGRHLIVGLLVESTRDAENIQIKSDTLEKFISDFVPYYITVKVYAEVEPEDIEKFVYRACYVGEFKYTSIVP